MMMKYSAAFICDLTQDFQFKVHAVLPGLVDSLAHVFPSIFLLHAGNLQYLSTFNKEIPNTLCTLSTALQNHRQIYPSRSQPALTWKHNHSVCGGELASLPVPADFGWRDGITLAGQADGVSQDHLCLLRHVIVIVVTIVLLVTETPGRLSI